ncbi:hypothetical protein [Umezawaea tangerina]|uniref:Uncharacterized protein n=1 Tax=Umezawaea tangerina TaxID=84725 RepID=A0A2T0SPP4_9PSEU|nr:hypothetical protein [Umezawaea tangerina]PRY35392.1 hypothetical protein CLV43_114310 [Umezawaea tangerina]
MSSDLEAAASAFYRAEAALEKRREELASAIAQAAREQTKPSEIVRTVDAAARKAGQKSGYTREHIRRILRAAGVEGGRDGAPPAPGSGPSGAPG